MGLLGESHLGLWWERLPLPPPGSSPQPVHLEEPLAAGAGGSPLSPACKR